jgi:hypothetical protein
MADLREQLISTKFCFKLWKITAESYQRMKQAFGDNRLVQTQTYDWYKRFKNGRKSINDEEHSRRSSIGITRENVARKLGI